MLLRNETLLASGQGVFGRLYYLVQVHEATLPAGSGKRLQPAGYAVLSKRADALHGQFYNNFEQAKEHFERVTTPILEKTS